MESRPDWYRWFITLTINPADYGAVPIGVRFWDAQDQEVEDPSQAVRASTMWSHPNRAQFNAAIADMSAKWADLTNVLNERTRRAALARWEYFRVTELHRNVWPHYHAVLEHGTLTEEPDLGKWNLGRVDIRPISVDDAVGELAPYLVCSESKGKGGHKAYQFAAPSLPRGFRLYSPSRGFLKRPQRDEELHPRPDHALVVRGHFTGHHESIRHWGGDSRLLLPTPAAADRPHRPPSSCLATGDAAILYFVELVEAAALHVRPLTALPPAALNDKVPAPPRAGTVPPLPPDFDELA
jgi:hypothetical protein